MLTLDTPKEGGYTKSTDVESFADVSFSGMVDVEVMTDDGISSHHHSVESPQRAYRAGDSRRLFLVSTFSTTDTVADGTAGQT
jgi:hypothetical protein